MTPVKSEELGRRARSPAFSALENRKFGDLGLRMRGWEDASRDYLTGETG